MGKWKHRIVEVVSPDRGVCSNCGPVKLLTRNDGRAKCWIAKQEQRGARGNPRGIRHGLTRAEREDLKRAQGGICMICATPADLVIDHDHKHCPGGQGCVDCIRGLLCNKCNTGLGFFGDDILRLESAIAYLSR